MQFQYIFHLIGVFTPALLMCAHIIIFHLCLNVAPELTAQQNVIKETGANVRDLTLN